MKFYEYKDTLPVLRTIVPDVTRDQMYSAFSRMQTNRLGHAHITWERNWHLEGRPFYRVWPKVLPMLLSLNLSLVTSSMVQLPSNLQSILVQLPEGNSLGLETILVGHMPTSQGSGVLVGLMDGKTVNGIPDLDMWLFPCDETPILQTVSTLPQESQIDATEDTRNKALSLVTTLCLLDNDLISPVLLAKDADKPITQALADKAKRRGRFGWDVGKGIEVAPHFRRPHPALMWTGEGRKVPKIVLRKGAIVHRSKVGSLPEGYLGEGPD